jgi:hypothetical protein
MTSELEEEAVERIQLWQEDWNQFAYEVLGARLDKEQQAILSSVQTNSRTSVASGTARGKDFVTAVSAVCFMYLTPRWNDTGDLIENTKVALTAPSGRQVDNIMKPEFARLFHKAHRNGFELPGRLVASDIRTDFEEWFLTGFRADPYHHEAWSGFHAVNTMFAVTEASGVSDDTFEAIEGNLQGNSRMLVVFNPNSKVGYAARSQKGSRWTKFRLNSLSAPNVVEKRIIIPGQVDYNWVVDKLELWCKKIRADEIDETQDDFEFEGQWYRPNDTARKKVLGKFPKVDEGALIAEQWIELANERWIKYHKTKRVDQYPNSLKLGVDVAGMGRDSTVFAYRRGNIVTEFYKYNSGGTANHMETAGRIVNILKSDPKSLAFVDTIGEGAGVISATNQAGYSKQAFSCKYSESAKDTSDKPLNDLTGQYTFANMRAYLYWAVRDWLDPKNYPEGTLEMYLPMLPPNDSLLEEATEIQWSFQSNGNIIIEPKEDIIERLKRSTDEFDALANTFYPTKAPINSETLRRTLSGMR